jgi:hypothetical protein
MKDAEILPDLVSKVSPDKAQTASVGRRDDRRKPDAHAVTLALPITHTRLVDGNRADAAQDLMLWQMPTAHRRAAKPSPPVLEGSWMCLHPCRAWLACAARVAIPMH